MDRPRPQELYRHFKGNLYQIVTIATHSETREEMVVYQALYGDYKVYVRPLDMFMSEVDRAKYPDVTQKMRFERVSATDNKAAEPERAKIKVSEPEASLSTPSMEQQRENFRKEPYKPSKVMEKSVDEEAEELKLDPLVIQFMDADLAADKNDILSKLRPTITNDMIDIMAMSLGVVVNEGDVYDRFNDLRTCLSTMEKFESTRLR
ncbi:DUF1653 domain-containing protein [Butyrivibrio sp. VCB2006]|uniref:DUF1653 domain-containing protein n=1 Tax=Butyrivibrio sp. VCB2006 TaxID=1280679 RepID=UPI0003FF32A4|nr:DUF1653 domain-containing protein [Butyrivibrio sp. VCB2006]